MQNFEQILIAHLPLQKRIDEMNDSKKAIFEAQACVTAEITKSGTSTEILEKAFQVHRPFKLNGIEDRFLFGAADDSGTACLTNEEFKHVVEEVKASGLSKSDIQYLLQYAASRTSRYYSHRRGQSVALRSRAYYSMFEAADESSVAAKIRSDLKKDCSAYAFIARQAATNIPKVVVYIVLDHIKNGVLKIMYEYILDSLKAERFFDWDDWKTLDRIARLMWEQFAALLLCDNRRPLIPINFQPMFQVLEATGMKSHRKFRELDSPKTLLRMAALLCREDISQFSAFVPLLYGGIEIPYALTGYMNFQGLATNIDIVPAIFSLNRVLKGRLKKEDFDEHGNISQRGMEKVIPAPLLQKMIDAPRGRVLCLDNNMTTGYSIRVLSNSIENLGLPCELAIAEVGIQEIKEICEAGSDRGKEILLRGKDFFCRPVGQYMSCFGLKDRSRVIDRVKFVLGMGDCTQVEGYDFDDTLFKTGRLHGKAWNAALQSMGIDFDIHEVPSNSGLTTEEAARNTYTAIRAKIGSELEFTEDEFVKEAVSRKNGEMLRVRSRDLVAIAKTINLIRSDPASHRIIISNNKLAFVLRCLRLRKLTKYFTHVICEDYAYCTRTRETVALISGGKPSAEAYLEASRYFDIPLIERYYGDNVAIDGKFARAVGCEFTLIKRE